MPNRPSAGKEYGGLGLSAQEVKAAFDKLPMLAIERINSLIDDIQSEEEGMVAESIKTGVKRGHTLSDFFIDLQNGTLASYLIVGSSTLIDKIATLEEEIQKIKEGAHAVE